LNFYAFNVGDYAIATAHLTELEDLYYRRLLDVYYAREQPIPLDERSAFRLVRASTQEAREAVSTVLAEYFERSENGWKHARCDAELATANHRRQIADARRANEAERQHRHREERKALFASLREFGELPSFDTPTVTLRRTLDELVTSAIRNGDGAESNSVQTAPLCLTQRLTNTNPNPNPNPIKKKKEKDIRAVARPVDISDQVWADWLAIRKVKGMPLTETALSGITRQAAKAGKTLAEAIRLCAENGWAGFRADWLNGPHGPEKSTADLVAEANRLLDDRTGVKRAA
jgi:uncharacterized protein YdaU (DUF1376 family)